MPEHLYCPGQKVLRNTDAWYRTFRGYPKMNRAVRDMITEFVDAEQFGKMLIFFTGHCGFDTDYSEFLIRELVAGNL